MQEIFEIPIVYWVQTHRRQFGTLLKSLNYVRVFYHFLNSNRKIDLVPCFEIEANV